MCEEGDGETMPLIQALELVVEGDLSGSDVFVSCIPGRLAFAGTHESADDMRLLVRPPA
jgi:hypothetical protein